MKKATVILITIIAVSAVSFSFVNKQPVTVPSTMTKRTVAKSTSTKEAESHNHKNEVESLSSALYENLKLNKKGMSKYAFDVAVKGYLTLKEQGKLRNTDLLTIVDLSQSSRKRRFYLIDMENIQLLENTFVAHAKNSGVDMAKEFSNIVGSEKTSLGFYVTKGTYTGKHGLSLRLAGLEKEFNDNAEERAIVVHGADYVNAGRVQSAFMGRSQGCPAVPMDDYVQVINKIKNGSALFIYSPDANYLNRSPLLNS